MVRGRHAVCFHLLDEIRPIIFVTDFDRFLIGGVAKRVIIVVGRGNQIADGLTDHIGNQLPFIHCHRFVQSIDDHDPFVCFDHAADTRTGGIHMVAGDDLSKGAGLRLVVRLCRGGGELRTRNENTETQGQQN